MFRDRPLTWLFVIATTCIYLVLLDAGNEQTSYEVILVGCLYGQLAVAAIWAVRGKAHRLLRASYLVCIVCFWAPFLFPEDDALMFVFIYTGGIYFFTLIMELIRIAQRDNIFGAEQRKQLQVPLIEFFGWTIVVAIFSFGCRDMEFDRILDRQASEVIMPLLTLFSVPFLIVIFIRKDLRDLSTSRTLTVIVAALASALYIGNYVVTVQAAYLIAWMTMLTLDIMSIEAARSRGLSEDDSQPATNPKLFNPQD